MKRTFNLLLLLGSVIAMATAFFVVTARPAGTSAAPTLPAEPTVVPSLPPLDTKVMMPYQNPLDYLP